MAAAVEFGNFGDWTNVINAAPLRAPVVCKGSVGGDSNAVYRRHSDGAANREPTYHDFQEAKYVLPNDLQEHVRLETQAVHISEMMRNNVLHAPIKISAERVLDIGCGTGIVTDLMSQAYPESECIGLDLSVVPQIRKHEDNVHFFQGNAAAQKPTEWILNNGDDKKMPQDQELFDHIFSRLLILGMNDWPSFIKTELDLLKPGGWAEVQDLAWHWYNPDGTIASEDWQWLQLLNKSLESKGLDVLCGLKAEQWMREAGFVDVQVTPYIFPACGITESTLAAREFGKFNAEAVPVMLHHAIAKAVCPEGNPDAEMQAMIDEMRAEMKECLRAGQRRYQMFYVTIGRKPE